MKNLNILFIIVMIVMSGCDKEEISSIKPDSKEEGLSEVSGQEMLMYGGTYSKGPSRYVSTIAGDGTQGSEDGPVSSSRFAFPHGLAKDKYGNIYVADGINRKIRKISTAGMVTTLAGSGLPGSVDGHGAQASFEQPLGIAVDKNGNVYVSDVNNKIRKISPAGIVSTLAGTGELGSTDGPGKQASFKFPEGIAVDDNGNVYVADTFGAKIRKITPSGIVSTFAGTGTFGSKDGHRSKATVGEVVGIAIDKSGNIFFADTYAIRKISTNGIVSTYAGSSVQGDKDGLGNKAAFYNPKGLAIDQKGNVYVADGIGNKIRKIDASRSVTTYAGGAGTGSLDGEASKSQFYLVHGIVFDAAGNLLVSDLMNNKIRMISNHRSIKKDVILANNR